MTRQQRRAEERAAKKAEARGQKHAAGSFNGAFEDAIKAINECGGGLDVEVESYFAYPKERPDHSGDVEVAVQKHTFKEYLDFMKKMLKQDYAGWEAASVPVMTGTVIAGYTMKKAVSIATVVCRDNSCQSVTMVDADPKDVIEQVKKVFRKETSELGGMTFFN